MLSAILEEVQQPGSDKKREKFSDEYTSSQKHFLRKGNALRYVPQEAAPKGNMQLPAAKAPAKPLKTGLVYLSMY